MKYKVEFKYNEPMVGGLDFDYDLGDEINEYALSLIEEEFPEAIDIEIVRVTHAD